MCGFEKLKIKVFTKLILNVINMMSKSFSLGRFQRFSEPILILLFQFPDIPLFSVVLIFICSKCASLLAGQTGIITDV